MHRTEKYSQHSLIIWPVWIIGWVFVYKLSACGFESRCCHLKFRNPTISSKEFLDIQATIECRFTLRRVRDMITTSSQEYCFIRILLYIMSSFWSFLILRLEVKKMDMVFSLSKWTISLLSTNQYHMFAKSSFSFFLISLTFLFWNLGIYHRHIKIEV